MKKLCAGLLLFLGLASPALAQQVINPLPNAGNYGAYNSSAPTCVSGSGCWFQTDVNGNLKINIAAGGGAGGVSATDQATFTQGVSGFNPVGCAFSDASTLSAGQQGTVRCTTDRQMKVLDSAVLAAVQSSIPAGTNAIGNLASQYPGGAVPITASATGTTTATTATLAASVSIKTYICGFSIRANATAAATNNSTVTGTVTGTLNYTQWTAPLASGIGLTEQIFNPCIPSSAVNTGIAVISGAPGSGGVVSVTAWGYQL